jgi:hypothetical protein
MPCPRIVALFHVLPTLELLSLRRLEYTGWFSNQACAALHRSMLGGKLVNRSVAEHEYRLWRELSTEHLEAAGHAAGRLEKHQILGRYKRRR